jgi:RNA polymerase sigma-70 factor (ECF subfamily)
MPADKSIYQDSIGVQPDDATLIGLYEQFRRPIYSYAYRLLSSQEDADDVTQEVFVRAFVSWDALHEREHLSAWLYRIATNLCVDLLRRRKRVSWKLLGACSHEEQSSEKVSDDLSAFLSDSGGIPEVAERELIHMALKCLPIDFAVVLVLSAAQGVPYQEIAEIVGVSPQAAATRISRAKKKFVEQYQRLSTDGLDKRGKQYEQG